MGAELTPEQIAAQEQTEKDVQEFNKGLQALIERTRISLAAKIAYTEDGMRPVLKHVRLNPVEDAAPKAPSAPTKTKKNAKAKK
jgi:hypothetical protein